MGSDDSKEEREGGRLDAAFNQQANSQVKLEIVDQDLNPTDHLSIASWDDSVRFAEHSPTQYENGEYLLSDFTLGYLLKDGTLTPADIIPSSDSKNSIYLVNYDINADIKQTVEIPFPVKGSDQPFMVTFNYDDAAGQWRSQPFAINKLVEGYKVDPETRNLYKPGDFEPSKSRDRFYVQYRDPNLTSETIQVTLKTQNLYNPKIKDSTVVTLRKVDDQPGLYRSDAIVLTSFPEVDRFPTQGRKDNKAGDTTVLASVGSRISVSYHGKETMALVPVEYVAKARFYVFKDKNGKPVATPQQIQERTEQAQRTLAPAGFLIQTLSTETLEAPLFDPKISDIDYEGNVYPESQMTPAYYIDASQRLSRKERGFLSRMTNEKHPEEEGQVIRVMLTGDEEISREADESIAGEAVLMSQGYNAAFVARQARSATPGHEFGHNLGLGHFSREAYSANLMLGESADITTIRDVLLFGLPKSLTTLTPDQIDTMTSNGLRAGLLEPASPEMNQLPSQTQQAPATPRP